MIAALSVSLLSFLSPVADSTDDGDRREQLLSAVRSYVLPLDADWDSTAVRVAWTDLNGDTLEDALVYLTDRDWCGSGGCTVMVFEAMDEIDAEEMGSYRPAAEISLMHGPVHVAKTRRGAWSDLIVEDEAGLLRRLVFDGETYPQSPVEGSVYQGDPSAEVTLFAEAR